MVAVYIIIVAISAALAHFQCWPALAPTVALGILVAFAAEARALARKRRARALERPAST